MSNSATERIASRASASPIATVRHWRDLGPRGRRSVSLGIGLPIAHSSVELIQASTRPTIRFFPRLQSRFLTRISYRS